jgi:Atypical Arm repeat
VCLTAFDSVVMAISEAGGLNAIEELQNHPNQNIYQRAVKMLEVRTLFYDGTRTDSGILTYYFIEICDLLFLFYLMIPIFL